MRFNYNDMLLRCQLKFLQNFTDGLFIFSKDF